jgi:glycosyltransferase involved in cell wall biosynthesis
MDKGNFYMLYSVTDNPIRVLQIVTQMNRAGLESRLMDIYRNIDRSRVQFDFYTCRKEIGSFDDEIKTMGGVVYYNDPLDLKRIHRMSNQFKLFLLSHTEYKIVHCHLNQWCGLVLKGAEQAKVPVRIAHSRTSLQKFTVKNMIKNVVKLSTNRYATHYFAVSIKAGEWLFGKRMIKSGKVEIWPNAIDCKKFVFNLQKREKMRKMLGLGNDLTLIHVGNLRPEKNHAFLFQIFKQVLDEQPSAKLILVGRDMMDGTTQSLAKGVGIDKSVQFLGSRSDVSDLLQAGDVFVFPSLYEGFPGAVLEAQAAGLPCVISDTITDEVCITNNVKQLPLGDIRPWVEEIIKAVQYERKDTSSQLYRAGYDITTLTEKLTDFYIKHMLHL